MSQVDTASSNDPSENPSALHEDEGVGIVEFSDEARTEEQFQPFTSRPGIVGESEGPPNRRKP